MTQSTLNGTDIAPLHVAIIMDGNGRWANRHGRPRRAGHRAGALAVRRTVEAARKMGIGTLTLFAFSADNWKRPRFEVLALFALFRTYVDREEERCKINGVRVSVVGRRDRLPSRLLAAIERIERETSACTGMHLRLAIDYSSRDAILEAAGRWLGRGAPTRGEFGRLLQAVGRDSSPVPDVDLLVRTGGERRISDFLLWESAYAEILFSDVPWPEFEESDFAHAIDDFRARTRRFGAIDAARPVLAGGSS